MKVFASLLQKAAGCRAEPCGLKSGEAATREGRSIVIPARRAVNNAPALFLVASFCAWG